MLDFLSVWNPLGCLPLTFVGVWLGVRERRRGGDVLTAMALTLVAWIVWVAVGLVGYVVVTA